jgi:hypothetical protein
MFNDWDVDRFVIRNLEMVRGAGKKEFSDVGFRLRLTTLIIVLQVVWSHIVYQLRVGGSSST